MVGACPYPFPQGSQVFLHDTASALLRIGQSVRLVVYDHGAGDTPPADVALRRAKRWPLARDITASGPDRTKPLHDAALLAALRRTIRSEGADIVCAHNYEALLVALAARVRPVVYMAHNALADELPFYFDSPGAERTARNAGRWFDNTFPRRADRIIAPHRRLAGYLVLRGCRQGCLAGLPHAVLGREGDGQQQEDEKEDCRTHLDLGGMCGPWARKSRKRRPALPDAPAGHPADTGRTAATGCRRGWPGLPGPRRTWA